MADNKVNSGLLEFSEDQKVFVALDAETSEVKKAVTIDEDGVETDIQGVQPTGKKEITTTEEVNVANYATAQVVDEDLVASNIKKDVDILGVVGSYEPAAPASDFSTAEVTINATYVGSPTIAYKQFQASINYPVVTNSEYTGAFQDFTGNVILYNNEAYIDIDSIHAYDSENNNTYIVSTETTPTVTGSGAYDSEANRVNITGDCTINITMVASV